MFGPEDEFFNRFATLARALPALPVFGGGATRLQPVFVGDVALAALAALNHPAAAGRTYELGGPDVMTLREIMALTLTIIERRRALIPVPFGLARLLARTTEIASALSLGAFPKTLTTTRDEIELLRHDNVVSAAALADGRTLHGLGVEPQGVEAIAPSYLYRFRKTGQYAARRATVHRDETSRQSDIKLTNASAAQRLYAKRVTTTRILSLRARRRLNVGVIVCVVVVAIRIRRAAHRGQVSSANVNA